MFKKNNKSNSIIVYYTYATTQIGSVLLISRHNQLIGLYIKGQKNFPVIQHNWAYQEHIKAFTETKLQLGEYFAGKRAMFNINYSLDGNFVQNNIWQTLTKIPYGSLCTYKQFAALTIYPHAIRIVASTIAQNPLSILLPCHRVIKSNGSLGGYAAGTNVKKNLLTLERSRDEGVTSTNIVTTLM